MNQKRESNRVSDEKGHKFVYVFFALIFAATMYFGIWGNSGYQEARWIEQDGVETSATVVAKLSHGMYQYEYRVNGTNYTAAGYLRGYVSDKPAIGSQTLVYVSASHPDVSSPEMKKTSLPALIMAIVCLLGLESFLLWKITRKPRASGRP